MSDVSTINDKTCSCVVTQQIWPIKQDHRGNRSSELLLSGIYFRCPRSLRIHRFIISLHRRESCQYFIDWTTFHQQMIKAAVMMRQIFSLFPISGLCNTRNLAQSSPKTLYTTLRDWCALFWNHCQSPLVGTVAASREVKPPSARTCSLRSRAPLDLHLLWNHWPRSPRKSWSVTFETVSSLFFPFPLTSNIKIL